MARRQELGDVDVVFRTNTTIRDDDATLSHHETAPDATVSAPSTDLRLSRPHNLPLRMNDEVCMVDQNPSSTLKVVNRDTSYSSPGRKYESKESDYMKIR